MIHLSDHGMAGVPTARFINLTDYLEADSCKMYGSSPVLQIVPKEGRYQNVGKPNIALPIDVRLYTFVQGISNDR